MICKIEWVIENVKFFIFMAGNQQILFKIAK